MDKNTSISKEAFLANAALGQALKDVIKEYEGKVSSEELIDAIKRLIDISEIAKNEIINNKEKENKRDFINQALKKEDLSKSSYFLAFNKLNHALSFINAIPSSAIDFIGMYYYKKQLIIEFKETINASFDMIKAFASEYSAFNCPYISNDILGEPIMTKENKQEIIKMLLHE